MDFLMVIMTCDIARGRVRTTMATESRNMAAILQILNRLTETYNLGLSCTSLILDIHVMIDLTPPKTRYPLTSIT